MVDEVISPSSDDELFVQDRNEYPEHLRLVLDGLFKRGALVVEGDGRPVEHPSVVLTGESHRWFWRPRQVRVVLIAESHVWTEAEHATRRIAHPLTAGLTGIPDRYVRLIYCLASGETALLNNPEGVPTQRTEFWNIFGRAAGTGRQPTASGGADLAARIVWKVQTLDELARRGVWLLDASAHAIYSPGGRVSIKGTQVLQRQWADSLGSAYLAGCPGAKRIAIGKGVFDELRRPLRLDGFIYQPQAQRGNVNMDRGWPELLEAISPSPI